MSSVITVRPVPAEEDELWDDLIARSPQGTVYHLSAWRDVVEAAYGKDSWLRLGCFHGEELAGGWLGLLRTRVGVAGAVMPLLTPYSGYVLAATRAGKFSDRASRIAEVLGALEEAARRQCAREDLILAPGLEDPRPLIQTGYRVTPRFTYHLDLSLAADDLWNRLDGHVRRQIKKGERENFQPGELDCEQAWQLFQRLFTRRGNKRCPVSRHLFNAVVTGDELVGHRRIWTAVRSGQLLSYIVSLEFNKTIHYAVAATDEEHLGTGASSWLIWQMLECCAADPAIQTFDFAGANIASIAKFKEGFNPALITHWRLQRAQGAPARAVEWLSRLR